MDDRQIDIGNGTVQECPECGSGHFYNVRDGLFTGSINMRLEDGSVVLDVEMRCSNCGVIAQRTI